MGDGDFHLGGSHVCTDHEICKLAALQQGDGGGVGCIDLFACAEAMSAERKDGAAFCLVLVEGAAEGHDIEACDRSIDGEDADCDAGLAEAVVQGCAKGGDFVAFCAVQLHIFVAESFHNEGDNAEELFVATLVDHVF